METRAITENKTYEEAEMRRKYIKHPELILCPECENTVAENWLIRHIKSGCKTGGVCYPAPQYNSEGEVRRYRRNWVLGKRV